MLFRTAFVAAGRGGIVIPRRRVLPPAARARGGCSADVAGSDFRNSGERMRSHRLDFHRDRAASSRGSLANGVNIARPRCGGPARVPLRNLCRRTTLDRQASVERVVEKNVDPTTALKVGFTVDSDARPPGDPREGRSQEPGHPARPGGVSEFAVTRVRARPGPPRDGAVPQSRNTTLRSELLIFRAPL